MFAFLFCFILLVWEGRADSQHWYWEWRLCFHWDFGREFFSCQRPGFWGIFQIKSYYQDFIAIFLYWMILFFFILYIRLFWLLLPLCHQRRAVMAPTWTAFVSLGQTSCRKAQHRKSGTGWKLCVLNHTTRSEHSHLKLYVKYINICIWNVLRLQ